MKRTTIICDCCNKECSGGMGVEELVLPVKVQYEHSKNEYMRASKMDICEDCAKAFMDLYYSIAEEHGHSGKKIFCFEED